MFNGLIKKMRLASLDRKIDRAFTEYAVLRHTINNARESEKKRLRPILRKVKNRHNNLKDARCKIEPKHTCIFRL